MAAARRGWSERDQVGEGEDRHADQQDREERHDRRAGHPR
jgi:hypothetical protein